MAKWVKRPVVVEATQWHMNGDHPEDGMSIRRETEGKVVRRFRSLEQPAERKCKHCLCSFGIHGWIDTLEGGHIVCPEDFIITGVRGERYPCKPEIFRETYSLYEGGQ